VNPTSALTTIVSDGPLYVYFDVDEQTFLAMSKASAPSTKVRVGLVDETDFPHEGTVDFLDNRVDERTGTVRTRAVIQNADGRLLPGLFARVRLIGGRTAPAALVDDKAIMTDQDRKYVFVVDDKGLAQRKNIGLGRVVDGLRVAESGLDANDRVIVHGTQKVFFPGMPVKPTEIAMGAPPPAPPPGAAH
jgi:multidrug efflux system membrane fusion protein